MYVDRLKSELKSLGARRINIRRQLDAIARGHQIGDPTNTREVRTQLEAALRGTQARWEELHHNLGIEHRLRPPVKLLLRTTR